jgi:hypothetical protein
MQKQVSNNIAAVIHYVAVFIATLIIGMLVSTLLSSMWQNPGPNEAVGMSVVMMIIGLVILYFITIWIGKNIKQRLSYDNPAEVVRVTTIIFAVISVLMSLPSIFAFSLVAIINVIVGIFVFYVASKASL